LIKNLKKIEEHNKKFKQSKLITYELGVWENSDLSEDEVNNILNGFIVTTLRPKQMVNQLLPTNMALPLSLNYTALGAVTAVRSQGLCGNLQSDQVSLTMIFNFVIGRLLLGFFCDWLSGGRVFSQVWNVTQAERTKLSGLQS